VATEAAWLHGNNLEKEEIKKKKEKKRKEKKRLTLTGLLMEGIVRLDRGGLTRRWRPSSNRKHCKATIGIPP
jgi:hypothetical protein